MKWLKLILLGTIAGLLLYFGEKGVGDLPAPGKLFDPFAGFWQNKAAGDELLSDREIPGLQETVQVVWDDRHVPHIFAQNTHDLYLAQGYILARDRLWQMDFITRAADGRLAEILGERLLPYDRFRRRLGMTYATENALRAMQDFPDAMAIANAFSDGVNAWIAGLSPKDLPLEFKLMDYAPEPWQPEKSALVLKYMAWDLTGRFTEKSMTRTRAAFPPEVMQRLYPFYPPFTDPIIPPGTAWDFQPLSIPASSENVPASAEALRTMPEHAQILGSNNWAVSGSKTASGNPILCNDPHLGLNLPSIWYEMQLSAPGVNVYGVTLPGTPGIIIGFNENIAWGFTNAGSDVLDWYEVEFRDGDHTAYRYNGEWRATTPRVEEIKVKGGATVRDTVYYTHQGPVVYLQGQKPFQNNIPTNAAMRWVAHDPSAEILTFLTLNSAKNYEDYLRALSYFDCPAQNTVYADVEGNIAIWHNGKFPLRRRGQGRFIEDGSSPESEWLGWIPREHNPHVKNPPRGFVSSANQAPADPSYPYYLGWNYARSDRGSRINEVLRQKESITPADMMALQLDNLNMRARRMLPGLLPMLPADSLSPVQQQVKQILQQWDFKSVATAQAPIVFQNLWNELYRRIWADDIERKEGNLQWPRGDVTIEMILNHPESAFFDDRNTGAYETLPGLVVASFRAACDTLISRLGAPGPAWEWGRASGTDILHLARIPGMGRMGLRTNGGLGIVNATGRTHGPSWRMIVELEPGNVKAWGIYPGGQSGNPGSRYYDSFVDDWVEGKYYPLVFLKTADEENEHIIGRTRLGGAK